MARIYGYERIPEDVSVPMAPSARPREDRVLEKVRQVLLAAGFDEAVTLSVVDERTSAALSPWTDAEPLRSALPVIRGADRLRRSIVPSLLAVRRTNESQGNAEIELFEIARAYLPEAGRLPREELLLGIASGRAYPVVKGVVEAIVARLKVTLPLEADQAGIAIFDPAHGCRFRLANEVFGYVGQLSADAREAFDLRGPATVAEIRLRPLIDRAELVPRYVHQSPYPAVSRDLNLVVAEAVRWAESKPPFAATPARASNRSTTATPTATPSASGPTRRACCSASPGGRPTARSPASRPTRCAIRSSPPAARSTRRN